MSHRRKDVDVIRFSALARMCVAHLAPIPALPGIGPGEHVGEAFLA